MKILIAGTRGLIGSAVSRALEQRNMDFVRISSVQSEGVCHLDLMAPGSFDYSVVQPGDVVIMAAALSSPEVCEQQPDLARQVNVTGTCTFITMCVARGARVLFLSSDTVYGENASNFDENAPVKPAGFYAETKAEVEDHFRECSAFQSIRLSYVFSRSDKFNKYLQGCLARNEVAEVFDPFFRAVVHIGDVVQGLLSLALDPAVRGARVMNFGGPHVLSRMEFAKTVQAFAMPELRIRLVEPDPSFFKTRPHVIRMQSPIFEEVLGRRPCTLDDAARLEYA
jgi:dTDP-4-dehydrorhamnose reductase